MSRHSFHTVPGYNYFQGFVGGYIYAVPNATDPVAYIKPNTQQTDGDIALVTKGNGALLRKIPNNGIGSLSSDLGGNKRGNKAVDLQAMRGAADEVASGSEATIPGGFSCKASGARSFATCDTAYALGAGSVAMGTSVTAQNTGCSAWGAQSDSYNEIGAHALANGILSSASDCQTRWRVQRRSSANATPVVLTTEGTANTATNTIILPLSSVMLVEARVVAKSSADYKTWLFYFTVTKAGAGTGAISVLPAPSVPTVINNSAGAAAWTIAAQVSGAANNAEIACTGAAATNINWVAFVRTTEMKF